MEDLDDFELSALRRVKTSRLDGYSASSALVPSGMRLRVGPVRSTTSLFEDDDDDDEIGSDLDDHAGSPFVYGGGPGGVMYGSLDDFDNQPAQEEGGGRGKKRKAEPEPPEYVTAPDIKRIEEELGDPDPPSKCVGCRRARENMAAMPYNVFVKMNQMYRERASAMDEVELAEQMYRLFESYRKRVNKETEIRNRNLSPARQEKPIDEWSRATIWAHMNGDHRDDSGNEVLKRSREIKKAISKQYRNGFYVRTYDSDGRPVEAVDPMGLKVYKELLTLQLKLLSSKPANMILSSSTSPNVSQGTPFMDPSGHNVYGFHHNNGLT